MNIVFDKEIEDFLSFCSNNNIDIYLVGGAVRDYLLNEINYDLDFALTNSYINAYEKLSKLYVCDCNEKYQSIKFVIGKYSIEISHCRIESEYLDYRHPNDIEFCDDIRIDSRRRDFTVNALYYKNGKIYDFYNGLDDLKNRIIRTIGDTLTRFKEDPLRILRMIRFSCLGFNISKEDERIIQDSGYLLKELTNYSFDKEFDKILSLNNLYILLNYKFLFEEYFNLKFKDLLILEKLVTIDEKKTYLGIKNKSNLYKYKDIVITNDVKELSKLIYKLSKEVVFELVNYYDKVHDSFIMDIYNEIINSKYYSKKQLNINGKEIIEFTNKEELTGYYIDKISYSIIDGEIKNEHDEIVKYILEREK